MKIAVPTGDKKGLDDTIAEHFGRCNAYMFARSIVYERDLYLTN